MSSSEISTAYHNLWKIEKSFRIMKSQLNARPVYPTKKIITGYSDRKYINLSGGLFIPQDFPVQQKKCAKPQVPVCGLALRFKVYS